MSTEVIEEIATLVQLSGNRLGVWRSLQPRHDAKPIQNSMLPPDVSRAALRPGMLVEIETTDSTLLIRPLS